MACSGYACKRLFCFFVFLRDLDPAVERALGILAGFAGNGGLVGLLLLVAAAAASAEEQPEGADEAESEEDIDQAAEEAFSMSEDDLDLGGSDADSAFDLEDADMEDLEDFSVEDLSDLNLDDDDI